MRRSLLLPVSCLALALALAPLFFAQAAGGAGEACILPGNACNAGLTCVLGVCTAPDPVAVVEITNPFSGVNTLDDVVAKVLGVLVTFGAPLAGIMIVIGGFQMLFAGGSEEKFASGKKTILYTVIGYGIIVLADGVAIFIRNLLV